MADITVEYVKKRGGLYKEVTEFEAGFTNDGVFGIDTGVKKYQRLKRGLINCEEAGIYGGGVDMTAKINAVYALAKVPVVDFNLDAGGEILITGTVTIPAGKVLRISPGTMLKTTGAGVVNGGIIQAGDKHQIFSGTKNFNPAGSAKSYVSVNWWGANNGVDENGAAISKAIQAVVKNQHLPTEIVFPDRQYNCTTPVFIYNWEVDRYAQAWVHLRGRHTSNSGGDCALVFSNPNWGGILMQQDKGSIIEGFRIQGTFAPPYTTQKAFFEQKLVDYGGAHGHRDTGQSPHCGINIDFARHNLPPDGGYPDLPAPPEGGSSWYRGVATNSGSSLITVRKCNINGWIVNYACSINGLTQNGDSMTFEESTTEVCKWAFSYGQDQTKNCVIKGILAWSRIHTFLTNRAHGVGGDGSSNGCPPTVSDVSIAGNVTRLFDIDTSGKGGFKSDNIFAEGLYKIGTVRGMPSSMSDSQINFNMVDYQNQLGDPDVHGNLENFEFNSCVLRNYNGAYNKRTRWEADGCTFNNVMFDRPPILQRQTAAKPNIFQHCKLLLPPGGAKGSMGYDTATAADFAYFLETVKYGKFKLIKDHSTSGTYTYEYDEADYDEREGIGTFAITIDPATRIGTLNLPLGYDKRFEMAGLYLHTVNVGNPNDVFFYDEAPFAPLDPVLGRIVSYDPATGATVVEDIQTGYVTGSYVVWLIHVKYVQRPFVGDMEYNNTVLTNVENSFPQVNDRIDVIYTKGKVTAVDTGAKTVTMSVIGNYNATDVLFNPPKSMRFDSPWPPYSNALDPNIFLFKGTKWHCQLEQAGTIKNAVFTITKSGYVLAGSGGRVRQAEWFQEPETRANPTTGIFEFLNPVTGLWEVIEGGGGGTTDVIDTFTLTADGERIIPAGFELVKIQVTSTNTYNGLFIGSGTTEETLGDLGGPYQLTALKPTVINTSVVADVTTTIYFTGITGSGSSFEFKLKKTPLL